MSGFAGHGKVHGGLIAMVKIGGISYQSGGDGIEISAKTKKSENWCVHDSSQRFCPRSKRKELSILPGAVGQGSEQDKNNTDAKRPR